MDFTGIILVWLIIGLFSILLSLQFIIVVVDVQLVQSTIRNQQRGILNAVITIMFWPIGIFFNTATMFTILYRIYQFNKKQKELQEEAIRIEQEQIESEDWPSA